MLVDDLIACGRIAKYWKYRKLFYALKDCILKNYGQFDGYDLQIWTRDGWDGETESQHCHILKRYLLNDHLFHEPTDEFKYFNFYYQTEKISPNYSELVQKIKQTIIGTKDYSLDTQATWPALKRLVRQYGHLLRSQTPPQMELPL